MVPPRSPPAARFCSPSSLIHSVIMPTTGSDVSPNSVVEASLIPAWFRARLDARHLHAEADAEEGNVALAGELDAGDLALAAALAEAAGDEDAVQRLELGDDVRVGMLEQLGVDPFDVDLGAVGDAAVDQRLAQALVGVGQADIFADDADRDLAVVMVDAVHDLGPARDIRLRRVGDPERAQDFVVEPGLMILQRHVVDVARVERRDHRRLAARCRTSAIFSRSLSGSGRSQRHSSTSGWTPRLDSSRTDCWVGLVLSSPAAAIHGTKRGVDADRLVAAEVVPAAGGSIR